MPRYFIMNDSAPLNSPIQNQDSPAIRQGKADSYKSIVKGFSFFGGAQILNVIINLVRGKFVAVILGPDGMGISSLFNSASNSIQRIASLGLNQSIVRDVADDNIEGEKKNNLIKSSIWLSYATALLGFLVCVIFSGPLSKLSFGTSDYAWQFVLLGVGVGFGIAANAKLAILQGLHEVKKISYASIVGGLTGLFIGIPLYYIFGNLGIVPAIVAIFISLYIFYSVTLAKSHKFIASNDLSVKEFLPVAKKLLLLGIVLMAGDVIANLVTYLINLFVRAYGSIDDVGLYQAAHSLTYQYSGVIFTAMSMDYFPRLSRIASDNRLLKETVNRQSEIVAWLIAPAMTILIITTPILIKLLLAESFNAISPLMRWMGLGMLFRAFSFPMAYITFAKGNKRVFLILEGIFANFLTLIAACVCFKIFGLIGLGYALVIDNALCLIIYFIVNNRLYNYNFSKSVVINFGIGICLVGTCFGVSLISSPIISYSLMGLAVAISLLWSFFNLKSKTKS